MKQNLLKPLAALLFPAALYLAAGCSGGSSAPSNSAADSARRADSLAREELLRLEASRADSLRRDSIARDSLFVANALRLSDFITAGSNQFLAPSKILANLEAKGFSPTEGDNSGGNRRLATFAADSTQLTLAALLYNEPYSPVQLTFADDRSRDIFVSSITDAGFTLDPTGNYTHPSNTSWAAAIITVSGRRIFLEWQSADVAE